MARSFRKSSRKLIPVLVTACVVGAGWQIYKKASKPTPQANAQTAPLDVPKAEKKIEPKVEARVEPKSLPTPPPLLAINPTTKPVTQAPAEPVVKINSVTLAAPMQTTSVIPTVAEGKAKIEAGDFVAGRKMLNDALLSRTLSAGDEQSAKTLMAKVNEQLVFSAKYFAGDPLTASYTVKGGDKLTKIASESDITWELLLRINNMSDPKKLRAGRTIKLIKGPFHAVVSKSKFKMDIYLGGPATPGSTYVTTFNVGLGKDDSTPTGTWMVEPHKKIKNPTYFSPRGEGVMAADDPKNPLGEFWLGLTGIEGNALGKSSYGIHGTIEPETIGKMASMGCIRLLHDDIAMVFELLIEGKSTVVVKE